MKINNISSYEIIEMLWQKLPNNGLGGGKVFVVVDIEDGEVYGLYEPQGTIIPKEEYEKTIFYLKAGSKEEIISNWILDEDVLDWIDIRDGRTRFGLDEDELNSCVLDVLHERFEKDILKRIEEILQKYPHLV